MNTRVIAIAVGALMAGAFANPALALHAKPGEWQVSVKMSMAGMPQIPPKQLAQMRAMGIHLPVGGDAVTMTHCLTPEEAAIDHLPAMSKEHQKYCTMQNLKTAADGISADMVCTGKVQGNGHMSVRFDTPEHYVGNVSMNVIADGHPMNSASTFEATWLSAECKAEH